MEEEIKIMKKIVDMVGREWAKLSPAARVYVKHQLDALDVDATSSNVDKERV